MLDPKKIEVPDDQDTNVDLERESIFNDEPFYNPKSEEED